MSATREPVSFTWPGFLLGFALSGFFDGILLHQVLQWHHLLLGVESGALADLRVQILADGLFHVLMYVIAVIALLQLLRARRRAIPISDRALISSALIGFGAWHVIDAVVSHWLLGIHRIKMDSPNPLFWDLAWVIVFGLAPLVTGILMKRRGEDVRHTRSAVAALVGAVLVAAPLAARAPADSMQVVVYVKPAEAHRMLSQLDALDAGILWADKSGALWILTMENTARATSFYDAGAVFVTRSPVVLGCLAWTRT